MPATGSGYLARLRRLPPTFVLGLAMMIPYIVVALTGELWAPYDFAQIGTGRPFSPADGEHLFGTDQLGRDVFSRVVHGTDDVLFLALSSTLVATALGGLLGLACGLLGGWFDIVMMRIVDALIGIPFLILALLIVASSRPESSGDFSLLIVVVTVIYAPRIARMARSVAVDLAARDFVTIARMRGESVGSIIWRELTPNAVGVLLVEFGVRAGYAPLLIGSLSFLGFGVQPPTPEWGLMISESRAAIFTAPMAIFAPAAALAGVVISLNLFSDGVARLVGRTSSSP